MDRTFAIKWPKTEIFHLPGKVPPPACPLGPFFEKLYLFSLRPDVVLSVALGYFASVHFINSYIRNRQVDSALKKGIKVDLSDDKQVKKLPAVPVKFATTKLFKVLIFFHNLGLCIYSVWTLIGTISTIKCTSQSYYETFMAIFKETNSLIAEEGQTPYKNLFWSAICDINNGVFSPSLTRGLTFYAYLFYLSKYYEILDTVIILLKGRPSSLLQSYHHAGAMLSMWSGVRYTAPPIWIFVVFNSFIHSLMYFYYTLSVLKVKIPKACKQALTSMQICQFVFGGSLAVVHLFVHYFDNSEAVFKPCIKDSSQFFALYVNVFYLMPLTILFTAFWIDSYARKNKVYSYLRRSK